MKAQIDARAAVDPAAKIGDGCIIGAFAVIGPEVEIGEGCRVDAHALVQGSTRIGPRNQIFPFASIGTAPQDLGYRGEDTRLEIGSDNTFREFVTINRGTVKGGGVTRIGSQNLFMAYCHVAHDCQIGDRVVMANAATLAGHVIVEDDAILGGLSAVHQFARVGAHAILGGGTMAPLDIPPYMMAAGNHAQLHGINVRGLSRRGFSKEQVHTLKRAYRLLFRSGKLLEEAMEELLREGPDIPEITRLLDFIRSSKRGITRP
ncbi:acyl-ACP--UDP-N-acetylglucosamine O-acyltransferase [Acidithiobacillus sp. CV18-2]|uniref:Acyl-[acyl-carrier-protein]--UDP-N-acetylglucosamine O-acyltransferase n=1 Tax=Igneacidithiobacillus copahuensis TaxID=2724909 RepID=A0AAE2YRA4_9PROT|nr:acyl-ACP--UDP-N-acetylglucosamine O-acyltransferase [Igneacidithiobacillus copahuensis]MBU2753506.1 acyl-ACP--UDP-N-acetylglucosamine O-acyltransferase [Acidithiobacillus sp. CV18-3]MBU2757124.1 acyl-ACP--UDP-N-acetylglucosamine O-acyltransferase [Acidithiobacillus sp. BN09-2]MBU2776000.1 acyl-ACP--UDP-N-acetylglucosamine O-acyltransferase [Acidithiobacillus sp. CV18-2]MBU2795891.1 acyl-ACP--UDP-N-acetylglucosamine O-acyltransferase [Acidithiobacillus sp. VAN18-2]MBU2800323.1 acyl-ACP--UDP-